MTLKPMLMDTGSKELETSIQSPQGATPAAIYAESPASESVGDLATRAYGFNTKSARDTLRKANATLDGLVRIPRP